MDVVGGDGEVEATPKAFGDRQKALMENLTVLKKRLIYDWALVGLTPA